MGKVGRQQQGGVAVLSAAQAARVAYEAELQRVCADLRRMIQAAEGPPPRPVLAAANRP